MPPLPAQAAGAVQVVGRPSIRLRVVAHASPRWRGARDADEADRRNLELSQRRAEAVAREARAIIGRTRGAFALVSERDVSGASRPSPVQISTEVQPGVTSLLRDHRGSQDTLGEAGGRRVSDDPEFRRVDVIIEWERKRSEQTRVPITRSTLSRNWALSVEVTAGGSVGAAGALLAIRLFNTMTKQSMDGQILAAGGGLKAKLGVSQSIWSDPTPFTTEDPMTFEEFDGNWIRYENSWEISAFLGYSRSYFSFSGMGEGAKNIDTGGWSVGAQGGAGGLTLLTGKLALQGAYPPTEIAVPGSTKLVTRAERTVSGGNMCKLHFVTGDATLAPAERILLEEFLGAAMPSL